MGHRGNSEFRGRPYGPDPFGREAQDRTRIAQTAAKLIAEHGIADWTLAKRKAARQLMLPERTALPGDAEIESALADYHALFGGVAAGWATAHSDIELDLVAATVKSVEMTLLNGGVDYRTMNADDDGPQRIHVDTQEGSLRLTVRSPEEARQRPRRDRHGTEIVRLTRSELANLLER